jgi:diguanylate cyclase (GGDEF)-like protein
MDTDMQAGERNLETAAVERINQLIRRAENVDREALEALSGLAREISEASACGGLGRYGEALAVLQEAQRQAGKTGGAPLVVALSSLCMELKEKSDEIARKARELEESYRIIRTISEIGRRITNSLDVEMVLSTVYKSVDRLMDAHIFAIGLYDAAMDIVDYRLVVQDGKRQPLFQVSADDGNSVASSVVKSGKAVMLNGNDALFTENASVLGAAYEGGQPRSVICCPLTLADRVTGVIVAQSFRADAYAESNLETVKALASYIAIALNNSGQSEELKAKAEELELASRTDALTGLYNRRHAIEKIEEERIRFQRNARPFSIVICDIDLFKKVNDVYGHDCGDSVLKSLAGLLGRHIRKQDCLARWGGEEFLLLLPETNAAGAAVLAEKLRKRVEEFEFTYAGLKLPITMTFGVAEYLSEYGVDACIVGADSALYKGKNSGRNCVVTF